MNLFVGPKKTKKTQKEKNDSLLKIYLTFEQKAWVEETAKQQQVPMSKCIGSLIEACRLNEGFVERLDQIQEKLGDLERTQHAFHSNSAVQIQIILAYVKEIFRESSANLYRLNAVIDGFTEPEKVRAEVNEYVHKQESAMRTKALQIQEANL